MDIAILYTPAITNKLADLMIEGHGFTAITKSGVKIRYRDYNGQIPFLVSIRGHAPMDEASEYLSKRYAWFGLEDAINFAAAPAFRQALESKAAYDRFLNDLRKQEELKKRKAEEDERERRRKKLLTPEKERELIKTMGQYAELSIEDRGMAHRFADKVLCEALMSMGYVDLVEEYRKVYKWFE